MDNRLVLTVLLVTLSWISAGTYAQSNMTTPAGNMTTSAGNNITTPAGNNMTTPAGNMTTPPENNMTTPPGNNMTTPPGNNMTTPPGNMTTPPGNNMTTPPGNNMTTPPGNNMTTPPGNNMTTPPGNNMTTPPGNNMTTPPGNNMTGPPGNNMTTPPGNNMTTPPGNNMTGPPGNMTTPPGNNMTTPMGNNMTTPPGNNMTTPPGNNMTTPPGNNMTTPPGNNMTTPPGNNMTTPPGNMTTPPGNMTTPPGNNMTGPSGNNMTTPPGNMTTPPGNMTTPPGNNMTTPPGNNMTGPPGNNMTGPAGNNMTTPPATTVVPTTTAPPLTPNITVQNLETPINNTGCGTEQLCAAEPSSCNPAVAGSCFFLSARQTSGRNFEFGLSGQSDGYIAATLSSDSTLGGNDTTYICANNNSVVAFFSAVLDNNKLILTELNVNNVRGSIRGNTIQCTFAATVPDSAAATSRSSRTSGLALTISTGPFDNTTGTLGAPAPRLVTPAVNLANPNTTIVNQISTTNTTNTTTASPTNMTTPAGNNMTTPPATTVVPTTTAPPLTPNITVQNLETPINNTGCGTEQLCAAEPSSCNPAVAGSCFFLSARQTSGRNFEFGLSGEADGYIAATLSSDSTLGGNDTTYICANNNSVVAFFSAVLDNNKLILTELNVNNVRGSIRGNTIQCTFAATVPDSAAATSRSSRTSGLALTISTGPFDNTTGTLGAPAPRLVTPAVNLANPNTTIVNQVSTTNTTNITTASPTNTTTALATTVVPTTAAPPLIPNFAVQNLETTINNTGCGTVQLCAAEPSSCNPAVAGSCFFLSARQTSGQNFDCGLSGESDGYIAVTLSIDSTLGGNDTTFICANNNSVVAFFSAVLDNNQLILTELNANNVRGRVDGNRIQCTFAATVPGSAVTPRSSRTSAVTLAISSGSFDSTTGTLGAPAPRLLSTVSDLANPNATIVNQLSTANTTTTAPPTTMTTSHAITLQQSLTQAMLIAAGLLGLFML